MKTRKVSVGGKPFSSRNPTTIGAIGLVLIIGLLWAAFNAVVAAAHRRRHVLLRLLHRGREPAPDDDVRIAGVKVGTVDSTRSTATRSRSSSRSRTPSSATRARCRSRSRRCSAPSTSRSTRPAPSSRTPARPSRCRAPTSPFDVYPAFTELTKKIDNDQHRPAGQGVQHAGDDVQEHPEVGEARCCTGLSRAVDTIASRDQALRTLLARAEPGHRRARRPRHRVAEAASATAACCSTSSTPAATPSTRCWSTPRRCRPSSRGSCTTTRRRSARCSTRCDKVLTLLTTTRTASTAACRCSARSTASSTTPSATAAGSTTTSATSASPACSAWHVLDQPGRCR